jgi:hypothetical protein
MGCGGLTSGCKQTHRKHEALEAAETAWADWETEWVAAVKVMGLGAATLPEAVAAQLDTIDRMREIAVEVNQLRHERIDKIERDIDVFAQDVKALVAAVANDLVRVSAGEAVLELERRLDEAKRSREQRKNKDNAISSLQKKIEDYGTSGREARETIHHLQEAAGVKNIEQLNAAIQSSEGLRKLESERARVIGASVQDRRKTR